jgi:hypothetical protein
MEEFAWNRQSAWAFMNVYERFKCSKIETFGDRRFGSLPDRRAEDPGRGRPKNRLPANLPET